MTSTHEKRESMREALKTAHKHVTESRSLCAALGIIKAACACDEAAEAIDAELKKHESES